MNTSFYPFFNGSSVAWAAVPVLKIDQFIEALSEYLATRQRLVSYFAVPQSGEIVAVVADDANNQLAIARGLVLEQSFPSLSLRFPQCHLFEREIFEQAGWRPDGHPWLKPVRAQGAEGAPIHEEFFVVEGREVHEVGVGPVHAGVIEPGHFRFQCDGEEVMHLEIALGYQHRGVETALTGGPHRSSLVQVEAVSGDSTAAHATAYASVLEALANTEAPLQAQWIRAIALELERLACHVGDIGALAGDVAFLPTSSANGKIRGDFLNLTARLCGNRFSRSLIVPGGVRRDVEPARNHAILEALTDSLRASAESCAWFWEAPSVRSRFEDVGCVTAAQAEEIGLVGVAARACGLVRDVRQDHPIGWHRFAQVPISVWPGGDVLARAKVRTLEIERSGELLKAILAERPGGEIRLPVGSLTADTFALALVEGWRGEVCHAALTDSKGNLARYKITDPSFHNWTGLALALRGTAISDFPICNKSFNLSYCGFDL